MKKQIIYGWALLAIGFAACQDSHETTNTTTNADTAVLVEDPNNALNANPVNDTVVADTVHTAQ